MEREELFARLRDLHGRARKTGETACTGFLTPAEQVWAAADCRAAGLDGLYLWGGQEDSERKMAFFFPDWIDSEGYGFPEVSGVRIMVRFGAPTHRDVMGSILGLGIERRAIGDIAVEGEEAWLLALAPVAPFIVQNLEKVGRCGAKAGLVGWAEIPRQKKRARPVRFTVQSMRLDAVAAGLFNLSRAAAASAIQGGKVSLNHLECQRADARVAQGDVLSLRGEGKGRILGCGGTTRKGRVSIEAERYI